jgi:hypothetical protein
MVQPVVADPLEPLYEGWQRGLAIMAHPDDLRTGRSSSGAITRSMGPGVTGRMPKAFAACLWLL